MISGDSLRDLLSSLTPLEAAPRLLGARLRCVVPRDAPGLVDPSLAGEVVVRLVEVEAYAGEDDPGSHGFSGRTPRTDVMFGDAGRLYAYFTYGMHTCGNVVVGPEGTCGAVLLRGAEVLSGHELARRRRAVTRRATAVPLRDGELARGPANLVRALGVTLADNGAELCGADGAAVEGGSSTLELVLLDDADFAELTPRIRRTLRTGVSGPGGIAPFDWRFHLEGATGVSPYLPHPTHRHATGRTPQSWYG